MPTLFDYTASALGSQVGSIIPFGGGTVPAGYMLCDGSSVNRTTFAKLFGVLGTAYGTLSGTTFNIPDMRGRFPRGVDLGTGNDPDATSRTASAPGGNSGNSIGSVQPDMFYNHGHGIFGSILSYAVGGGNPAQNWFTAGPSYGVSNAGGNETRPKNIYVNFIIKY